VHGVAAGVFALGACLVASAWRVVIWTPGADPACVPVPGMGDGLQGRLEDHVAYLASEIGPRSSQQPHALDAAGLYVVKG
jgi:hypothetical protein